MVLADVTGGQLTIAKKRKERKRKQKIKSITKERRKKKKSTRRQIIIMTVLVVPKGEEVGCGGDQDEALVVGRVQIAGLEFGKKKKAR
jgi:hypothetical protein